MAADNLGISGDMLRWYLAHGIVTVTGAMSGNRRLWTQQDITVVREQLDRHNASRTVQRYR